MRKLIFICFLLFFSCSKEDECDCRTATVQGEQFKVRLCDENTFNRLEEFGSTKEASLMEQKSNCSSQTGIINEGNLYVSVQERLNQGEKPLDIFNDIKVIDSLYGKEFAGGVIFHFNTNDGKGLVAMKNGQLENKWGPIGYISNAMQTEIGSGQTNTIAILNYYLPENQKLTGAYACDNLILNGFDDWFMPSKDEVKKMADILFNEENSNTIGIGSTRYWTSSSIDSENAWSLITSTTNMEPFSKNGVSSSIGIKAIRKF